MLHFLTQRPDEDEVIGHGNRTGHIGTASRTEYREDPEFDCSERSAEEEIAPAKSSSRRPGGGQPR
jgi:hypothetical protein